MNLTFAGLSWTIPALATAAVAIAILWWGYRTRGPRSIRWVCGILKFLAIAALALCLLEPLRSAQRVRPGANLFALVSDNSQSLQIKDLGQPLSRGDRLRQELDPTTATWQSDLAENFELRRYLFDARLQGIGDFSELTFQGRSSSLGSSLRTLIERLQGRPLAGVLLFTDGNATDLEGSLPDLAGLPPVYCVAVGEDHDVRDLSLARVSVSQSDFEDQPVSIHGEAQTPGFGGRRLVARLRDEEGRIAKEASFTGRGDGSPIAFDLHPKPEKPGLVFYELSVTDPDPPAAAAEEATPVNNSRILAVDRGRGPYRILYVAGRPNWEYKFLNRAISEDPQLQLVAMIRVARREPKFDFRGRAGETSNPLFRGFGEQSPEEVERYDQPVLVRLNTRDELELRSGFPRTPEELYDYHAVILDDIEAAFFAPDQAQVLQKFVSERGGGLLMLGGMECFREGAYDRTPIGDTLPVYLDRAEPAPPGTTVHFQLAREGWLQSWARVRDNELAERQRLDEMPPFLVANQVRGVKPGASVIATARDSADHEHPALAIHRFGRGRAGALLIGDLWRWGMRNPASRTDLDKTWRQLMRWLVTDVPSRVELTVEPVPNDPLETVSLQVRVRDAAFQPLDDVAVALEVESVRFGTNALSSTNRIRLRAEPSPSESGLFEVTFLPRDPGGYRATAYVTNSAGAEHGRSTAGWANNPAAEEFQSLVPNSALLSHIASKTGGQVVRFGDLPDLARRLPLQSAPIMETWSRPVWHTAAVFAFALACAIAEWGLRRWKGLP